MTGTQVGLTIAYAIVVAISCAALALVFRSTRARSGAAPDHDRMSLLENRWGFAVIVMLVIALAVTLFWIPYGRANPDPDAQQVRVVGQQFGWSVQPAVVRAGRPVQFRLTSKDVQHGFGIYRGTKLIFQVQVPARGSAVQLYRHTFDRRGTYEINCLEF